jgi:quercetin dioxygenase-like cupin family protein
MPYVDARDALNSSAVDLIRESGVHGPGPWRIALVGDPGMRVVLIGWPSGFATVPHHHPHAPEIFQVVRGRLGFRLDDTKELEVDPGTLLLAMPGQVHGLRVLGSQPLVILAAVGPNLQSADEVIETPGVWTDWQPTVSRWSTSTGR